MATKTITGIKAGKTSIIASYSDGGVTKTASVNFTVKPIAPTLTFSVNGTPLTYNGNNQLLGTVSYNGDGQAKYYVSTSNSAPSASATGWSNVPSDGKIYAINAGTYYVFLQASAGINYIAVTVKSGNTAGKEISKRAVTYTADNESWIYDGGIHRASNTATLTSGSLITGHTATFSCSGSVGAGVNSVTKTLSSVTIKSGSTDVTSNYSITRINGTLRITARATTVTAGSNSKTYDGNALTYNSASASNLVDGHKMTCTVTGSRTIAGSSANVPSDAVIKDGNGNNVTSNYSISYKNGTLTVNKCAITYTAKNDSWVYDGGTHSASNTATLTSGTLPTGHTPTFSCSGSVGAGVGSAIKTLSSVTIKNAEDVDVSSSFTITMNNGTLRITARPIEITASSASRPYNGSPLTSNSATAEATGTDRGLVSGHTMTSCTVTGTITSVGSVDNIPSAAIITSGSTNVTSNYDITYVNGKLTITQRSVTITAPQFVKTGLTYNGSNQTVASGGSCTTGGTMYYYISTTNSIPTFNANTWSTSASIQAKPAGTYYVWYYCKVDDTTNNTGKDINTVKKLSNSKEIVKKTVTLAWGTTSWTYDGNAHSTTCQLGGVISGDSCTLSLNNNSITYVGDKTVTTSLNNSNYQLPSASTKTITVTKATPVITITGVNQTYANTDYYAKITKSDAKGTLYWKFGSAPTTSSYGGTTSISSVGTPVGNPSALSTPINVTSVKNVTNQTLYWIFVPSSTANSLSSGHTYAENFNNNANGSVAMKITAAAIPIPTPTGYTGTYDANSHSATFESVTGASIAKYRWSSNGSSGWTETTTNPGQTNAGTIYVQASYKADSNHSIGGTTGGSGWSSSATITVNRKSVTVTAGSASREYNGSALTKSDGTTASGLIAGHSLTSYTNTGSIIYFGTANNTPSGAVIKDGSGNTVTSNYAITYAPGKLTITKANPQIAIQGITVDYTGGQFYAKVTGTKAKGTLYWKKGSAASASDSAVAINSTGTPLSTPINITSVKDNSDDFVMYWYFVPSSAANSLASGHTYAENYNTSGGTSTDKVNLTINPRSISNVTASATSVTYNGSQQTANVSISDSGATLTANDYTISGNTGTNATSYTITITGRNNYTGTKTITWTINKRPVTITANSASKTYDGTALTKNSVTASAQDNTKNTGMISSHHVHTWTVSGSQTTAGSSYNTVTAATIYNGASSTHGGSGDTTNVTDNYAITFAKGTLTVNKRTVTYKANDESKVYDGSVLTASNTAKLTSGTLPSGHNATFTCTGEIGPGVSSGTKTLSGVVIKNGSGVDVSSSFTIKKQDGSLSITNASIKYSTNDSVTKTCTDSATATTTTIGTREVIITSVSASGVGNPTITYSIDQDGWSVSSDGKKIIIPEGVAAGTYNVNVSASASNHTKKTNGVSVVISAVSLTGLTMELKANEVAYGSSTTVQTLTAKYSNGATKSVLDNATYSSNPTGIVTIS